MSTQDPKNGTAPQTPAAAYLEQQKDHIRQIGMVAIQARFNALREACMREVAQETIQEQIEALGENPAPEALELANILPEERLEELADRAQKLAEERMKALLAQAQEEGRAQLKSDIEIVRARMAEKRRLEEERQAEQLRREEAREAERQADQNRRDEKMRAEIQAFRDAVAKQQRRQKIAIFTLVGLGLILLVAWLIWNTPTRSHHETANLDPTHQEEAAPPKGGEARRQPHGDAEDEAARPSRREGSAGRPAKRTPHRAAG